VPPSCQRARSALQAESRQTMDFGGILVPQPGPPYAGEQIPMPGGAILGFQSLIQRIAKGRELIVLLNNTESPKILHIALEIRRALSQGH
jgi:hypothetical protein